MTRAAFADCALEMILKNLERPEYSPDDDIRVPPKADDTYFTEPNNELDSTEYQHL